MPVSATLTSCGEGGPPSDDADPPGDPADDFFAELSANDGVAGAAWREEAGDASIVPSWGRSFGGLSKTGRTHKKGSSDLKYTNSSSPSTTVPSGVTISHSSGNLKYLPAK